MKLTDVMKIWEELHVKDTGDIGFCDLDNAINKIVGVKNDVNANQPTGKLKNRTPKS